MKKQMKSSVEKVFDAKVKGIQKAAMSKKYTSKYKYEGPDLLKERFA